MSHQTYASSGREKKWKKILHRTEIALPFLTCFPSFAYHSAVDSIRSYQSTKWPRLALVLVKRALCPMATSIERSQQWNWNISIWHRLMRNHRHNRHRIQITFSPGRNRTYQRNSLHAMTVANQYKSHCSITKQLSIERIARRWYRIIWCRKHVSARSNRRGASISSSEQPTG